MSYSCDKIDNSTSKRFHLKQKEGKLVNNFNYRRYSPKNNMINNMRLIPNQETSSSGITNITSFKEKEKIEFPYFSFPVKALDECDVENYFMKKNKKIFESPSVLNDKKISFQRQKDKKIMEFDLFDDKIVFKDINRAYLQDEENDDGNDSSDEKIKLGKSLLYQEIEQSSKELKENLRNNQKDSLLSRKIRFKMDNNK